MTLPDNECENCGRPTTPDLVMWNDTLESTTCPACDEGVVSDSVTNRIENKINFRFLVVYPIIWFTLFAITSKICNLS